MMKKILATLVVLALVMPAIADVTFTATDNEDGSFTIAYTADTGDEPRGLAVIVTIDGAEITDGSDCLNWDDDFNCFMDYASEDPDNYALGTGDPFAAIGEAGSPTYPVSVFSVCMGVLDTDGNQAAGPTSTTDLVTIQTDLAEGSTATVTLSDDTYRGGVVGDAALTTDYASAATDITITNVASECINETNSPTMYADWETYGKPACWCYQKQCRGDADGGVTGPFRVGIPDLQIFLDAYNVMSTLVTSEQICADFDHKATGPFRVAIPDLQTFLQYYNQLDAVVPVCDLDWDSDGDEDYNFWTN